MISHTELTGQARSHVVPCGTKHWLQAPVVKAFEAMQTAAKADGIDLQIVSSFRDFARQQSIWQQKWQGNRPLYSPQETLLNAASLTDTQKLDAILTWSALPGASRHHWGTDLDVYDPTAIAEAQHDFQLVTSEYQGSGPCATLSRWLIEHCRDFGFYLPYQHYQGGVAREPWHLSYQPLAEACQQQLTLEQVTQVIEQNNVAGKQVILSRLPHIFQRYILNKGQT